MHQLKQIGWPEISINKGYRPIAENMKTSKQILQLYQEVQLFASPIFQKLWHLAMIDADSKQAKRLLQLSMDLINMPLELEGTSRETQALLAKFDQSISPADPFWRTFSLTVQKAFPLDDFVIRSGKENLKRQIHQFRYVISAQQAQWVRENFKKEEMTDGEALAAYFRSDKKLSYDIGASARLHNKAFIDRTSQPPKIYYPSGKPYQANFKVLINFHTEFILDCDGNFLNELDPESMTTNGIVNGASFNYGDDDTVANNHAHTRYDVKAPSVWDPSYRDYVVKNQGKRFVAPKYDRSQIGYLSKQGDYATAGLSVKNQVDIACRQFKQAIKPSFWRQMKNYLSRQYRKLFQKR